MTEEIRVKMKNIFSLTMPWKREAADGDIVLEASCVAPLSLLTKYGRAGVCSLLQIQVKMLVFAGNVRIQSTGGQDKYISEHHLVLKKLFTIHKFKVNNEVLEIFSSILKKLQNQTNKPTSPLIIASTKHCVLVGASSVAFALHLIFLLFLHFPQVSS